MLREKNSRKACDMRQGQHKLMEANHEPPKREKKKFFDRLREFYSARRLRKHGFASSTSPTMGDPENSSIDGREVRYSRQEQAFTVGLDAVRAPTSSSYTPCLELCATSTISGALFAGFFSGPAGCAVHACTAPPHLISVQHVLKAGSLSSMRWASRYGIFLGAFRLLSCCSESIGVAERSPTSLGILAGISGGLAAGVAPGFGTAPLGAHILPSALPPRLLAVATGALGCASVVYVSATAVATV